jgi:hypothetical protein
MNAKQVHKFVLSYLEATHCRVIERSPTHVTVKLSPEADRALTNRPYYWSFVDRTGTPPETMTFSWMFEKSPLPDPSAPSTPLSYMMTENGRIAREEVYFGSRRLLALFEAVSQGGRCLTMFEEPPRGGRSDPLSSIPYTAWLGANFKVGFECDMKREEMYGWGISLATGVIDEKFLDRLREAKLTPRLPSNVHLLRNGLSLRKGMNQLESSLERRLKTKDFDWAKEAEERRQDELARIQAYYDPMIERSGEDETQRDALMARFRAREAEIDWQYRPRVTLSVMNCGIFHLPGIH